MEELEICARVEIEREKEEKALDKCKPLYKSGIPFCSRKKCGMFISRAEAGWGIFEKCILWDKEEHGREPHLFCDTVICRPKLFIE